MKQESPPTGNHERRTVAGGGGGRDSSGQGEGGRPVLAPDWDTPPPSREPGTRAWGTPLPLPLTSSPPPSRKGPEAGEGTWNQRLTPPSHVDRQKDRHQWKHFLPVVLRTWSVTRARSHHYNKFGWNEYTQAPLRRLPLEWVHPVPLVACSHTLRWIWEWGPLPGEIPQIDLILQLYYADSSHHTETAVPIFRTGPFPRIGGPPVWMSHLQRRTSTGLQWIQWEFLVAFVAGYDIYAPFTSSYQFSYHCTDTAPYSQRVNKSVDASKQSIVRMRFQDLQVKFIKLAFPPICYPEHQHECSVSKKKPLVTTIWIATPKSWRHYVMSYYDAALHLWWKDHCMFVTRVKELRYMGFCSYIQVLCPSFILVSRFGGRGGEQPDKPWKQSFLPTILD